jgi:hypothetical protein
MGWEALVNMIFIVEADIPGLLMAEHPEASWRNQKFE